MHAYVFLKYALKCLLFYHDFVNHGCNVPPPPPPPPPPDKSDDLFQFLFACQLEHVPPENEDLFLGGGWGA